MTRQDREDMNAVSSFRDPRVSWAAALLMAPFFLQMLGFGQTFLGGGLCGALLGQRDIPLSLQGAGFWYALLFMLLLGIQLMYGGFLLLGRLLEMPKSSEHPIYIVGIWLIGLIFVLFLLTRTTGLPYPSEQGLALGDVAKADPLSLILMGLTLAGGLILWGLKGSTHSSQGQA